ncbi:MarR family winged helix-turn-helix transcriptional regulator [Corynebacterium falsenii]
MAASRNGTVPIYIQNCCNLVFMASTPLEIASKLRPSLTRLYLLYFRQAENSTISMAQLSIMMILDEKGPMRISQIASTEAIRMPTASNAVNQLETMGLVTRVRDISDRRGVRVDLTDKGREELEKLSEERANQLAGMLEGLNDEELERTEEAVSLIDEILHSYAASIEEKLKAEHEHGGRSAH